MLQKQQQQGENRPQNDPWWGSQEGSEWPGRVWVLPVASESVSEERAQDMGVAGQ